MDKKDDLFKKAFENLDNEIAPTDLQKEFMLNRILHKYEKETVVNEKSLLQYVLVSPWRFAFAVSAIQTIVLTLIFGTQYTNLIIGFFGG